MDNYSLAYLIIDIVENSMHDHNLGNNLGEAHSVERYALADQIVYAIENHENISQAVAEAISPSLSPYWGD